MKDRRLDHPDGRNGRAAGGRQQRRQVALDPQFDILQQLGRVFAVPRQDVEGQLRVEYRLRLAFEGEQIDRLLLQLVETRLAALARWLEDVSYGLLDRMRRMQTIQDQGES